MFSDDLNLAVNQCHKRAKDARHEFITVEHLLLSLLDNPPAASALRAVGADLVKLGEDLKSIITETVPVLSFGDERDAQPTLGFQRVLQRAVYHVQSASRKEVTGVNVLVAIFGEKDSHAVFFLNQQNVTRLDVVNYISHGWVDSQSHEVPESSMPSEETKRWIGKRKSELVLEIIEGRMTVLQAAQKHNLNTSNIQKWIEQGRAGLEDALRPDRGNVIERLERQIKEFREAYGEAMLELRALKNRAGHLDK